jgi:hypothetical protein
VELPGVKNLIFLFGPPDSCGDTKGEIGMTMTSEDVIDILGPVDETLIADVVATGASQAELAEAFAWVNNDEALMNERRPPPTGKIALLIDLLVSDNDELD